MWLRLADRDDGNGATMSASAKAAEQAELREAQKRIWLLEQENEILRRAAAYLSQAHLPKHGSRSQCSRGKTLAEDGGFELVRV